MENTEWDEKPQDGQGDSEGEEGQRGGYQDKFSPDSNEAIVKGLSFKAEGDDVRDFFSQYGEISNVNIERRYNGESKGSCFIKFTTAEGLENACVANGVEFMGRQVWIAKTKPKSERVKEFGPRRGFAGRGRGGNSDFVPRARGGNSDFVPRGRGGNRGFRGGNSNNEGQQGQAFTGGYKKNFDDDNDDGQNAGFSGRGRGRGRGRGGNSEFVPRGRGAFRGTRGGAPTRGPVQKVDKSKIIFVGNLNYRTERDEIWDFFDTVGKVVDVRIAKNPTGSVSLPLKVCF
jgi:RNA recognition motif-containing protein